MTEEMDWSWLKPDLQVLAVFGLIAGAGLLIVVRTGMLTCMCTEAGACYSCYQRNPRQFMVAGFAVVVFAYLFSVTLIHHGIRHFKHELRKKQQEDTAE